MHGGTPRRPHADSVALMTQGLPLMPIPADDLGGSLLPQPPVGPFSYPSSGTGHYTSRRVTQEAVQPGVMLGGAGGMTGAEAAAAFAAVTTVRASATTPAPQLSGLDAVVGAGDDADVCGLGLTDDMNGPLGHGLGGVSHSHLPHGYTYDELAALQDLTDVGDVVDTSRVGSSP